MLERCNVNICSHEDNSPEPSQNVKEDGLGTGIGFERIRRITGYLVGDISRWNNGLHRADRIAEVCYTLKEYNLEVKKLQFIGGRYGMKPYLVLIEAVKGGKPAVEILPTAYNEK